MNARDRRPPMATLVRQGQIATVLLGLAVGGLAVVGRLAPLPWSVAPDGGAGVESALEGAQAALTDASTRGSPDARTALAESAISPVDDASGEAAPGGSPGRPDDASENAAGDAGGLLGRPVSAPAPMPASVSAPQVAAAAPVPETRVLESVRAELERRRREPESRPPADGGPGASAPRPRDWLDLITR